MVNLQSFFPKGYELVSVEDTGNLVHLKIKLTSLFSVCPKCGSMSNSIHSYYNRVLYDLSILTHGVSITLTCRKFFCKNGDCERKVFTERHDDFLKPYARRSLRLNNKIEKIAFTNNAETAAKLIKVLYMPISPSTILRMAKSTEIIITSNYKAIGIDDWAYRKGVTYGTLICDLETHKPIDLLDGRDTKTIEGWLKNHKEIQIITRDRASTFSKAIDNQIPEAIQIADKWHLMHNVFEVVKAIIDSKYPNGITIEDSPDNDKAMKSTVDSSNKTITLTKAESIKQDRLFKKQQKI